MEYVNLKMKKAGKYGKIIQFYSILAITLHKIHILFIFHIKLYHMIEYMSKNSQNTAQFLTFRFFLIC